MGYFGFMIEHYAEIAYNDPISENTWLLGLRSSEIVKAAKPGQFVMIRVRRALEPLLRRPFSICGVREDLCLFLYRVVGQGTAVMARLKEGHELSVLGPLGKGFRLPKKDQLPVLVAGGIGIAPLAFLAQRMKRKAFPFLMGFGSAGEIIDLEHISGRRMEISVATDDGTRGRAGPVTDLLEEFLKSKKAKGKQLSLYTCGPKPMLKKIAATAQHHKIPCQFSLEANMACGLGACQGCALRAAAGEKSPYVLVCRDGPVFPVHAIDWEAL
jgi:dihydroorotate dehydrogenase electron transfer subunit